MEQYCVLLLYFPTKGTGRWQVLSNSDIGQGCLSAVKCKQWKFASPMKLVCRWLQNAFHGQICTMVSLDKVFNCSHRLEIYPQQCCLLLFACHAKKYSGGLIQLKSSRLILSTLLLYLFWVTSLFGFWVVSPCSSTYSLPSICEIRTGFGNWVKALKWCSSQPW